MLRSPDRNPRTATGAFVRDTLASLVKPGIAICEELKCDIFETADPGAQLRR